MTSFPVVTTEIRCAEELEICARNLEWLPGAGLKICIQLFSRARMALRGQPHVSEGRPHVSEGRPRGLLAVEHMTAAQGWRVTER